MAGSFWTLERTAALLTGRADARKAALPGLLFFTDPERTPDPEAVALDLPPGAAIVFRPFGAADAGARGERLAEIAWAQGLYLLVGADADLAERIGADGVHLPQRMAAEAGRLKARHPGWIITTAAHSLAAARRAMTSGADAAVVSAIFPSRSPSAGAPMGPVRLAALAKAAGGPVYALGGVNARTAARLRGTGIVGLAAVDGLKNLRA